jgi:hypothetical protein
MVFVDWIHLAQDGFERRIFFGDTAMHLAGPSRQYISSPACI